MRHSTPSESPDETNNCVFFSEMNRIIVVPQKIFFYDNIAVTRTSNVSLTMTIVNAEDNSKCKPCKQKTLREGLLTE